MSPRRDRKSETITHESTGRSSRRARRRRGIPQHCPAPQLWQSGRRARRYSIGDEPGGARIRGTRPPSHSAQGRVFPRSPFSLARRKASASAPPPDCAAPLRGADAFAELRRTIERTSLIGGQLPTTAPQQKHAMVAIRSLRRLKQRGRHGEWRRWALCTENPVRV
jgi:hypothetical protein